jgi:anti-sigma factor RsiW
MATDRTQHDDVLRLNALVDGELSAAEQAALAARLAVDHDLARAHATLANLKAHVVASAEAELAPPLPPMAKPSRQQPMFGWAAAAAVVACVGIYGATIAFSPSEDTVAEFPHTVVKHAALPSSPVVPDLGVAGLKLSGIAMESPGGVATIVANYRGPRGCRLELRVRQTGTAIPAAGGTSSWSWTVGELAYDLTAYGMPAARFAAVASAAEHATRDGGKPEESRRLREASVRSGPCLG